VTAVFVNLSDHSSRQYLRAGPDPYLSGRNVYRQQGYAEAEIGLRTFRCCRSSHHIIEQATQPPLTRYSLLHPVPTPCILSDFFGTLVDAPRLSSADPVTSSSPGDSAREGSHGIRSGDIRHPSPRLLLEIRINFLAGVEEPSPLMADGGGTDIVWAHTYES
jgi:hypothetical protein